jgi:hypothetical protein
LRWRKEEYDARGEEAAFTEEQLSQTEALETRGTPNRRGSAVSSPWRTRS